MKNGLPRLISILVGGTENIMSFDMRQCGIILDISAITQILREINFGK